MMNKSLIAILAMVSAFVAVTGQAQTSPASTSPAVMQLTALDYFEIQQLAAKYAQAIDTCSNSGYDYADLFTEDGFFAPFQNGQLGRKFQGREALAVASGGGAKGCTGAGWIKQGVHHLYVNHIITPTAEGATGTINMLMIGLGGDPNKIEHDGYYEDTYAKTPKGWRFKSRIHHALYNPGRGNTGRGAAPVPAVPSPSGGAPAPSPAPQSSPR